MADTSRRHVLWLLPTLAGGGAERVTITLLKHLDRRHFRLTLAVVDTRRDAYRNEVPTDVEFLDLGCTRVRYALPKIVQLVWQRRPDVVFSTVGHLNLALSAVRSLLPRNVRMIGRETTVVSINNRQQAAATWLNLGCRIFYRNFDRVICQSHYMRDDLVANLGFPEDKAVVIHNPVDMEHIRSLAGDRTVITGYERGAINLVAAGRLSFEKGFELLLDSFHLCSEPRLRLTILGEGPLRPELEAQTARLGLQDRVRFAGFQRNPYPFLRQADAFVLSSRYEGFPNVVLEALVCNTPVIATPAPGGVREILEGVPGTELAREVTAEALADAIKTWIKTWFGRNRVTIPQNVTDRYLVSRIAMEYSTVLDGL